VLRDRSGRFWSLSSSQSHPATSSFPCWWRASPDDNGCSRQLGLFACLPCLFACQQFSRILVLLNIRLPVTHSVTDRSPQFATSLGHQKAGSYGPRPVSQHTCNKRPVGRQAPPEQKTKPLWHALPDHYPRLSALPLHQWVTAAQTDVETDPGPRHNRRSRVDRSRRVISTFLPQKLADCLQPEQHRHQHPDGPAFRNRTERELSRQNDTAMGSALWKWNHKLVPCDSW